MLINVLDNWLDANGKVIANGRIRVWTDRSSTDPVKLYEDPNYQNEFATGEVLLDTAGRLQGRDGTLFFKEDIVWVAVWGDQNGISALLFSFELYNTGRIGQSEGGSAMTLENAMNDPNPSSRIIYHAKKLKYLLWHPNATAQPNNITLWRPAGFEMGLYEWETTVLDLWDIGIENTGLISSIQNITAIGGIAKFIVKRDYYSFGDEEATSINFNDIAVEVESGANFSFPNTNDYTTWTVSRQPDINSMLSHITWNPTAPFSFRSSMLDNEDGKGMGLIQYAKIDRLYLDSDFCLRNATVNETIGSLTYMGVPPILTGEGCESTNAGMLTGRMKCGVRFKTGRLSQIDRDKYEINFEEKLTIDDIWVLTHNVNLSGNYRSSVVILDAARILGETLVRVDVNCITEAGIDCIGDNLDIYTHSPHTMLSGVSFMPHAKDSATNYIYRFCANPYVGNKLTVENFKLENIDKSYIDGITYINCLFGKEQGNMQNVYLDGGKRLAFVGCEWSEFSGVWLCPVPFVGRGDELKLISFRDCIFGAVLGFSEKNGGELINARIENVHADLRMGENNDYPFNLQYSTRTATLYISNFNNKSNAAVYSTEGAAYLGMANIDIISNSQYIVSAPFAPSNNYSVNRPFPLKGWTGQTGQPGDIMVAGTWDTYIIDSADDESPERPDFVRMYADGSMLVQLRKGRGANSARGPRFSWREI